MPFDGPVPFDPPAAPEADPPWSRRDTIVAVCLASVLAAFALADGKLLLTYLIAS